MGHNAQKVSITSNIWSNYLGSRVELKLTSKANDYRKDRDDAKSDRAPVLRKSPRWGINISSQRATISINSPAQALSQHRCSKGALDSFLILKRMSLLSATKQQHSSTEKGTKKCGASRAADGARSAAAAHLRAAEQQPRHRVCATLCCPG